MAEYTCRTVARYNSIVNLVQIVFASFTPQLGCNYCVRIYMSTHTIIYDDCMTRGWPPLRHPKAGKGFGGLRFDTSTPWSCRDGLRSRARPPSGIILEVIV